MDRKSEAGSNTAGAKGIVKTSMSWIFSVPLTANCKWHPSIGTVQYNKSPNNQQTLSFYMNM